MRYLSAYMLSVLGGKEQPSAEDLKQILSSVGIDFEKDKAERVIKALKGQDVHALIAKGKERLASMPSGGVAVATAAAPAAGGGGAAKEAPKGAEKAAKKEEKKEESESDEDMGFGLFD